MLRKKMKKEWLLLTPLFLLVFFFMFTMNTYAQETEPASSDSESVVEVKEAEENNNEGDQDLNEESINEVSDVNDSNENQIEETLVALDESEGPTVLDVDDLLKENEFTKWSEVGEYAVEGADYALSEDGIMHVYTEAGLSYVLYHYDDNDDNDIDCYDIYLEKDMDLMQHNLIFDSGYEVDYFQSVFDGQNHTVSNLILYYGTGLVYEADKGDAVFRNLNFKLDGENSEGYALIVKYVYGNSVTFENINIDADLIVDDNTDYFSFIAGDVYPEGDANYSNITITGNVTIKDTDYYVGLLTAELEDGDINVSDVAIDINLTVNSSEDSEPISLMIGHDCDATSLTVKDSTVKGTVTFGTEESTIDSSSFGAVLGDADCLGYEINIENIDMDVAVNLVGEQNWDSIGGLVGCFDASYQEFAYYWKGRPIYRTKYDGSITFESIDGDFTLTRKDATKNMAIDSVGGIIGSAKVSQNKFENITLNTNFDVNFGDTNYYSSNEVENDIEYLGGVAGYFTGITQANDITVNGNIHLYGDENPDYAKATSHDGYYMKDCMDCLGGVFGYFSYIDGDGGSLKNICFNGEINLSDIEVYYTGGVVGQSYFSQLDGLKCNADINISRCLINRGYVGGLVAENDCWGDNIVIRNSSYKGNITILDSFLENGISCILASNNRPITIIDTTAEGDITLRGGGLDYCCGHIGGIVGFAWSDVTIKSTNYSVNKIWEDNVDHDGVTVQLYDGSGKEIGDPVELNKDNNWSYDWKDLYYTGETGNYQGTYYVGDILVDTVYEIAGIGGLVGGNYDSTYIDGAIHKGDITVLDSSVYYAYGENIGGIIGYGWDDITLNSVTQIGDIIVKDNYFYSKYENDYAVFNVGGLIGKAGCFAYSDDRAYDYNLLVKNTTKTGNIVVSGLKNINHENGISIGNILGSCQNINSEQISLIDDYIEGTIEASKAAVDDSNVNTGYLFGWINYIPVCDGVTYNATDATSSSLSNKLNGNEAIETEVEKMILPSSSPLDDEGMIIYYVKELNCPKGYTYLVKKDGNTFTVYNSDPIDIPVLKKWIGTKLDNVTVKLIADGKEVSEVVLNDANSWSYVFKNLPKYNTTNDGVIIYTVEELGITGYITVISGNAEEGFVITNTEIVNPTTNQSVTGSVNTGYESMYMFYVILMLGATVTMTVCIKKGKKA